MTGNPMSGDFSQLLLGICAGALLAMAAAMLRAPRPAARWTGVAFFLASTLFAIKLWSDETHALAPEWRMVVGIFAMTSVGFFWLMVMALFQDRDEFKPWMFAAPPVLMLCGFGNMLPLTTLAPVIWTISTVLQATFAIWSLIIVVRSWKDDLVESRRRMRGPFMVMVALYILQLNAFDIWDIFGDLPTWYSMMNSGLLAVVVMAGALVFLDPREAMFGSVPAETYTPKAAASLLAAAAQPAAVANGNGKAADPPTLDRASKADIDRLEGLMSRQQVWREEGLTIASLAVKAGMPEAQLRRLVSDCLGYRNFPSYVNAHRIQAAKNRLADPNEVRVTVSTIAYDIGFGSLGPFNRAFREETGVSPSEWRRKAMGSDSEQASPISEEV